MSEWVEVLGVENCVGRPSFTKGGNHYIRFMKLEEDLGSFQVNMFI